MKTEQQLRARISRLELELETVREEIASLDDDAFGVVPERHDCPAYPIRDEIIHRISTTLRETPIQSFTKINKILETPIATIKAETLRDFSMHLMACAKNARDNWSFDFAEGTELAAQEALEEAERVLGRHTGKEKT